MTLVQTEISQQPLCYVIFMIPSGSVLLTLEIIFLQCGLWFGVKYILTTVRWIALKFGTALNLPLQISCSKFLTLLLFI